MRVLAPPAVVRPRTALLEGLSRQDVVFAVALASLFTPIVFGTPLGKFRPFDAMALLCLLIMLPQMVRVGPRLPRWSLFHLAFIVGHVLSAAFVSTQNGLREGLQVASVLMFASALATYLHTRPAPRLMGLLWWMVAVVGALAVVWHLQHGYFTGWKQLDESRAFFVFLPVLVAAAAASRASFSTLSMLSLAAGAGVLILMSGERKALYTLVLLLAAWFGMVNPRTLGVVFAAVVVAPLIATLDQSGYVAKQISTIFAGEKYQDFWQFTATDLPSSMSDAQRQFAVQTGMELLAKNPLFGIGTNQYLIRVNAEYGGLPFYLRLGIHGEFLRVLVENGVIGFALYCASWITALLAAIRTLPMRVAWAGVRDGGLLRLVMFGACLTHVAFEGAKTMTTVLFVAPLFLPMLMPNDLNRAALSLAQQRGRP